MAVFFQGRMLGKRGEKEGGRFPTIFAMEGRKKRRDFRAALEKKRKEKGGGPLYTFQPNKGKGKTFAFADSKILGRGGGENRIATEKSFRGGMSQALPSAWKGKETEGGDGILCPAREAKKRD